MVPVHIVIGSTGAGKSTYSKAWALEHGAMRFAIDEWMVLLFAKDRPDNAGFEWYSERIERCTSQIWNECVQLLALGQTVILEIGLTRKDDRQTFYSQVEAAGFACQLHVIEASAATRWKRVEQRNLQQGDTYSLEVTRDMFDFVESMWEPPNDTERTLQNAISIVTDS